MFCAVAIGAEQTQQAAATSMHRATIEEIANNPDKWYGKTVTVRAKVDDVVSRTLFEVEHDGVLGMDDELLVVAPRAQSVRKNGEWVDITGEVRRFVKTGIERTYSGTDWSVPDAVVMQFDARPSIVAASIMSANAAPAVSGTAGSTAPAHASIESIAEEPEKWYGKMVTIRGKVDDIFHRGVFDVEEGGFAADDEVLVIAGFASEFRKKDEWVSVTGRVSRFVDMDLQRLERDGDSGLTEEIAIQFEKRPTIIATSVTATAAP
jgi:hypothetical protein